MKLSEYDRGFRFKKNVFTVADVIDRLHDERIFLCPDHVYSKPWQRKAKSTFIESILLGMPTTEFWCEEDNYGTISVLDGTQRLQCLLEFCNDKFRLRDLRLLSDLEGAYYSDLPSRYASIIFNRAEFYFTTISYDTHPALKFEFFKRVNSDSYRFPIQAARNFAFREQFSFIREVQRSCSRYLNSVNPNYKLLSKNNYLHAASYDELFLLLSSLTLIFNDEMRADKETVQDLLDEAAIFINFSMVNTYALEKNIKSNVESISRYAGKVILFDPHLPLVRRGVFDDDESGAIVLTSNQIANLYIFSLKNKIRSSFDFEEVLDGSPRASVRMASSYYRRLFV